VFILLNPLLRFDREVDVSPPTEVERASLLQQLLAACGAPSSITLAAISAAASRAVGFVAADLHALVVATVRHASRRSTGEEGGELRLENADLEAAGGEVRASAARDVEVSYPRTAWEDIGGLEEVKQV
jgi:transitional endoplasmic reticulum ATPase